MQVSSLIICAAALVFLYTVEARSSVQQKRTRRQRRGGIFFKYEAYQRPTFLPTGDQITWLIEDLKDQDQFHCGISETAKWCKICQRDGCVKNCCDNNLLREYCFRKHVVDHCITNKGLQDVCRQCATSLNFSISYTYCCTNFVEATLDSCALFVAYNKDNL